MRDEKKFCIDTRTRRILLCVHRGLEVRRFGSGNRIEKRANENINFLSNRSFHRWIVLRKKGNCERKFYRLYFNRRTSVHAFGSMNNLIVSDHFLFGSCCELFILFPCAKHVGATSNASIIAFLIISVWCHRRGSFRRFRKSILIETNQGNNCEATNGRLLRNVSWERVRITRKLRDN